MKPSLNRFRLAAFSLASLATNLSCAFVISIPKVLPIVKAHSEVKSAHYASTSSTTQSPSVDVGSIVACYGRLADKVFVLPKEEIQGTAASGYEFGILQSGRPKWLCTYEERTGQTQGGGNEMRHVPNWCALFGEEGVLKNKEALASAIVGEGIKFQMPLSAPSGQRAKAMEPITDQAALSALWILLGGAINDDSASLTLSASSKALRAAALKHGSEADHLTWAVFQTAFLDVAATTTD